MLCRATDYAVVTTYWLIIQIIVTAVAHGYRIIYNYAICLQNLISDIDILN